MGRELRMEQPGTVYHVIQRGNNREFIFDKYYDKAFLLDKIRFYKQRAGFTLFGYVIMGNHYHLIIQTQHSPLQKVMQMLNNCYSKYYNSARRRTGHVFGGRYKAIPVQEDRYMLTLLRYVHQNPIRANICKHPWEYYWSSDNAYRTNINDLVNVEPVLNILSQNRRKALDKYAEFMSHEELSDFESSDLIGDERYALAVKPIREVMQRKRLDEILIETGLTLEEFNLIKSGSRKRSLVLYKETYAKAALTYGYTLKEIASNISLTDVAIHKLLQKERHSISNR
ncbi:MAG: transposase [Bacillota bacterium]